MQDEFFAGSGVPELYDEDDDDADLGITSDRTRLIIRDSPQTDYDFNREGILLRTPTNSFFESAATGPQIPAMSDGQGSEHGGHGPDMGQRLRNAIGRQSAGFNPFNTPYSDDPDESDDVLISVDNKSNNNRPQNSVGNLPTDERDDVYSNHMNNPLQIQFSDGHLPRSQQEFESNRKHCHRFIRDVPDKVARNQLIAISVLCFLFMIGEIVGGVYANSLALITDATHLASDLTSFLISLCALYIATKPPTRRLTFGYHRTEVLGAFASVLIIWCMTAVLLYFAIQRIIHHDYDINADDMLITAGCGVAFNVIMGVVLNSEVFRCRPQHSSFGHSHSHSHSINGDPPHGHHGDDVPTITKNINVRAAFIHVIGDLIQSVGVLIAAFIIKYYPQYKLADPICTFVFSILVLITTVTVLRDICIVMMEAIPKDIDYEEVKSSLSNIEGVKLVHSLHVWSLTLNKIAADVHLAVAYGVDYEDTVKSATDVLHTKFNARYCTVQVEAYKPDIMLSCDECITPE